MIIPLGEYFLTASAQAVQQNFQEILNYQLGLNLLVSTNSSLPLSRSAISLIRMDSVSPRRGDTISNAFVVPLPCKLMLEISIMNHSMRNSTSSNECPMAIQLKKPSAMHFSYTKLSMATHGIEVHGVARIDRCDRLTDLPQSHVVQSRLMAIEVV